MKSLFLDSAANAPGSPAIGVLLVNLGTPDEPTAPALRRYLKEFLSDPRVIELPRWRWLPVLHAFVLTTRPRRSAALYRSIWTAEGSPLLVTSRRQAAALHERLGARVDAPVHVALGMRYGNPSIPSALRALKSAGCDRILVLPLYPQYAGASTGTTWDAVAAELATWRVVPEVRFVRDYHAEPGYIEALAASVREVFKTHGEPDRLLLSYHGIPKRYVENGDPYAMHCRETSRLVAQALGFPPERVVTSFQSLFGKEEWVRPYTDETIRSLPAQGVKSLHVVCPGFSADCLETLEEISVLNKRFFLEAGGRDFHYVPALNDRDDHVAFLADLAMRHLEGWVSADDAGTVRFRARDSG